ncbi:MAG: hypothetical protein Q9211_002588 [Gyalolechia sp. 1 TL-2023]
MIPKKTETESGMSNTKADFRTLSGRISTRILNRNNFRNEFSQRIRTIFNGVPYITHPFLVVERKRIRSGIINAENLSARRRYHAFGRETTSLPRGGKPKSINAEHKAMKSSMTVDPRVATI